MVIKYCECFDYIERRALALHGGKNGVAGFVKFAPLSDTVSAMCIDVIMFR